MTSYNKVREVGTSSRTVVYEAKDPEGNRVALKQWREDKVTPELKKQFTENARFLSGLHNPNLVRVLNTDPNTGSILLELMPGSLARKIAKGAISPDTARRVLKDSLRALHYLHEQNIVHGAIHPSNILEANGTWKLGDFQKVDPSQAMRLPDNHKYLAPEVLNSEKFGESDKRLDLYCLAFAVLESLVGKGFESKINPSGTRWHNWHLSEQPVPQVQRLVPGIPEDLANLLDWMLKKNVSRRPESAAEVLDRLGKATGSDKDEEEEHGGHESTPDNGENGVNGNKKKGEMSWRDFAIAAVVVCIGASIIGFIISGEDMIEVTITTEPAGVTIIESGEELELTENKDSGDVYLLTAGEHDLVLKKKGYEDKEETIEVDEDETDFDFELDPKEYAVEITTEPDDVTITLDGEKLAKESGKYKLPYGTQSVVVSARGYKNKMLQIDVDDKTEVEPIKLDPDSATVVFRVTPVGAKVQWDEKSVVLRKREDEGKFELGSRTFIISKSGYETTEETIVVAVDSENLVEVDLVPIPVKVTVTTDPADAELSLDGTTLVRSDGTIELPVGEHEITIKKKGFQPVIETITVKESGTEDLVVKLERVTDGRTPPEDYDETKKIFVNVDSLESERFTVKVGDEFEKTLADGGFLRAVDLGGAVGKTLVTFEFANRGEREIVIDRAKVYEKGEISLSMPIAPATHARLTWLYARKMIGSKATAEAAEEMLTEAISANESFGSAYRDRGIARMSQGIGKSNLALKDFEDASGLIPDDYELHLSHCILAAELAQVGGPPGGLNVDRFKDAKDAALKAIAERDHATGPRYILINILIEEGSLDEAAKVADQLLDHASDPRQRAFAVNAIGMYLSEMGESGQAVKSFRQSIGEDSTFADPHYFLARELHKQSLQSGSDAERQGLLHDSLKALDDAFNLADPKLQQEIARTRSVIQAELDRE